jgi:hypothetical protein
MFFFREAYVMKDNRKNDRFPLTEDLMFARQMTHPYCYYGSKATNHSRRGICLANLLFGAENRGRNQFASASRSQAPVL